jgi:two-component system LytT family response regulator
MIDVIIVDDEQAGRRTLRECCEAEGDLRVIGEFGDGVSALEAIRLRQPQLLFLDIQMDPLNGIELARALEPSQLPSLVFVTAYDAYALEAFEVSAVDYLLKPFDQERFRKTLERVRPRHARSGSDERQALLAGLLAQLERDVRGDLHSGTASSVAEKPRLLAEFGGHLHVLDAARVELIEADRNYVVIRVGKDNFHARSTLQQAELALRSQPMLRISRSCLVNMNYVKEVNRTLRGDFILVLAGGATVTSSEGFRGRVKEYLGTLRLS